MGKDDFPSNQAENWFLQGEEKFTIGDFEGAIFCYDKAIEIESNYQPAWRQRGYALYKLERDKEALVSLDKAIEINNADNLAWYCRGMALNELKQYEEAISSFNKAIEINNNDYLVWYRQGLALNGLERYEEAVISFNKAIEINNNDFYVWKNRGFSLYRLGKYQEAISSFEKATELNPSDEYSWLFLGLSLYNLGQYKEAISSYNKAIELNPNNEYSWQYLGFCLKDLGRYEEAVLSFDKYIRINANDYNVWEMRGFSLNKLGKYEEALSSYNKAIEINANNYKIWHDRGFSLNKLGRYEEAISSYNKAIELNPDDEHSWKNTSFLLNYLGRYEEALIFCERIIELNPKDNMAWSNKGSVLLGLQRFEEAVESWKKSIELNPEYNMAWALLGETMLGLKRYEEAVASCDKAIELKLDDDEVWNNRGVALLNLGRNQESLLSFDKAIELNVENHFSWRSRGAALINLERYEEALISCNRAIEINPEFYGAWHERGKALHSLIRYEEALASYDKAIELKLDDDEVWNNRGEALLNLGRNQESLLSFDKAIELNVENHFSWRNRGAALINLECYEEAIISYNKAIEINPDFHEAWHERGRALHNLMQYEEALASYDKTLEIKPDYHYAWIGRGNAVFNLITLITESKNFRSRFILPVITTYPDVALIFKNPDLNKVGYEGLFASYKEGLKHCPQETEGWGRLHLAIGQVHYLRGCKDEKPLSHWRKAVNSYHTAITTLTEKTYPEAHLEVLQDLIRCLLALEQINEATELQRRGSDILQKLLKDTKSPAKQQQLALKFVSFQQLTVDLAVQSGNSIPALELAEQGKNACLSWLLEGWSEDISSPKLQDIQQLLNSTTAIIYWHLSPAALHTFILKYDSSTPIVLTQSDLLTPSQRLQQFEEWVKDWNQQYNDYRSKGKDEVDKNNHPWRNDIQTNLNQLKNILDIDTIKNQLSGINQLILIPHRDLHRFPLHVLFNADEEKSKFIITYLPSAKLGVTNTLTKPDQSNKLLTVEVSPPQDNKHLFYATLEAGIISQMFEHRQHIQGSEATKEELEAALENGYEIFHFAGHANYNFSEPKNSQLALANEDKLTLQDIYQKNLTTYKLVSLSACETAITGNQTITTEYVGLVSGFLSRGVAQVVSTLWTVESAASGLIMLEFYRRRQQPNKSDAQALTEATTWLRNLTAGELQKWYQELKNQIPPEKLTGRINRLLKGEIGKISKEKPDKILYNDIYYWGAFTITGKPLSS